MTSAARRVVVAIGGNSLLRDPTHMSEPEQYRALGETAAHIAAVVRDGWRVAITHGNGPQVGFALRRSELAAHELHELPLDVCDAETQGGIGYELQQNLANEFRRLGVRREAVTVVTQVEVSPDDPAFAHPTKPIGAFLDAATAERRRARDGWHVVDDAGRGWRRVVPSPRPRRIVECAAVKALLGDGYVVVTAGGGGIPVVADAQGALRGVAAVIDKDHTSALLATELDAEALVITTAVARVALDWGRPTQRWVDRMTVREARARLDEGTHFAAGSMAPKIEACVEYLERGGGEAIIARPEDLERALRGEAGTRIMPG